jgi:hypothetical protein
MENIPAGSAFLNLLAKGCRSRLGSDWTKRSVYEESASSTLF